jgi:signal transduction histidine kinase
MDSGGRMVISPGQARYASFAVAALVLAEIALTPVAGAGLNRLAGVQGSYVPVGDLIVDGCIVAIALVVIWTRPGNVIGWLMLAFAVLGATQNLTEAYGVRAQAEPHSRLPLGPLALSLGTSLWIPAVAVRASFVAITDADGTVLAQAGTDRARTDRAGTDRVGTDRVGTDRGSPRLTYPLTVAGQQVGQLMMCPARGESVMPAADARVIATLIAPVAAVVHAVQLTRRLAGAHERTLAAAQQERSRIRRDLHDGLGPSLSGVALGLEAVQTALPRDTQTAADLTARMRTEIAGAVEDVRRIIDELRPAALEDVGLVQALRERAASLAARSSSGLIVEFRVDEPMPGLPEQVEIAAFRIAEEAMTNVLRHAHASRCVVRLEVADALVVSVSDDGVGLPGQTRPDGVGLTSMRQRAAELGGCCTVEPAIPSGVIVCARFPLEVTA